MAAWEMHGLTLAEWMSRPLDTRIRLAAAPYMCGWKYGGPKVAFESPSVPTSLVSTTERLTNCSTLTASVLTATYGDRPWTSQEYGDLQVFADRLPANPDSPIDAVVRLGIGDRTVTYLTGHWHLLQGWRSLNPPSGHAMLVFAFPDGRLLVLESSSINGIGPRYKVVTQAELAAAYKHSRYLAILK